MEAIFAWACQNANHAFWLVFVLLFLAGLNIPISEDIVLLSAGALAATCMEGNELYAFYICCYLAAWISAWEVFWIGRLGGRRLYRIGWFQRIASPERIARLHVYYEKYGVFTFIIGRLIPGGVRNALFLSCGLGEMPFSTFIIRDSFACLISSLLLFSLGYSFAEYHTALIEFFKQYNLVVIGVLVASGLGFYLWKKKARAPL